jgi:hypothetical protein
VVSAYGCGSTYCVPSHFDGDVGQHESLPCVRLGLSFARLVQRPLSDEHRHDLVQQLDDDEEEHEHAKHLVLQPLDGVLGFEERKADDEGAANCENCFRVDV